MRYVKHVRTNGKKPLAALFEGAALIEQFRYFAEEAELAGLARSDADDFQNAIHCESYKAETMS